MKIRGKLFIALIFILFVGIVQVSASSQEGYFLDIPSTHWAYENIQTAYELGISKGYEDKTFRPNNPITPAEFFKMAVVASLNDGHGASTKGHWASSYEDLVKDYIKQNKANSFVDEHFLMDEISSILYKNTQLTRQDAAMISSLALYLKYGQSYIEQLSELENIEFSDAKDELFIQKTKLAISAGLLSGYEADGKYEFRAKNSITRAEAVTVILRIQDESKVTGILLPKEEDTVVVTNKDKNKKDKEDKEVKEVKVVKVVKVVKEEYSSETLDVINTILNLSNEARNGAGLQKLELNDELTRLAMLKAKDIAENNYFSHDSPTYGSPASMLKSNGILYSSMGENLVSKSNSAQRAVIVWMQSKDHKANILNSKFDQIGIGYYNLDYPVYVQIFIKSFDINIR